MGHEEQAVLLSMDWHALAGLGREVFPIHTGEQLAVVEIQSFADIMLYKFFFIPIVENAD